MTTTMLVLANESAQSIYPRVTNFKRIYLVKTAQWGWWCPKTLSSRWGMQVGNLQNSQAFQTWVPSAARSTLKCWESTCTGSESSLCIRKLILISLSMTNLSTDKSNCLSCQTKSASLAYKRSLKSSTIKSIANLAAPSLSRTQKRPLYIKPFQHELRAEPRATKRKWSFPWLSK